MVERRLIDVARGNEGKDDSNLSRVPAAESSLQPPFMQRFSISSCGCREEVNNLRTLE